LVDICRDILNGIHVYQSELTMTKQIAVRVPDDLDARLEVLAEKTGRTKTFYVREAIEAHLEDLEKQFLADRISARLQLADSESPWTGKVKLTLKQHDYDVDETFEKECRAQSQSLRGDPLEVETLTQMEDSADVEDWR